MQIVQAIPFRNFKEKIRLTKFYIKEKAKITLYNNYIYIELDDGREDQ